MEAGTRLLLTCCPADKEETRPLEEAELRVNDLSVCKGHGSKGTGMIGSGKTLLTPWQSATSNMLSSASFLSSQGLSVLHLSFSCHHPICVSLIFFIYLYHLDIEKCNRSMLIYLVSQRKTQHPRRMVELLSSSTSIQYAQHIVHNPHNQFVTEASAKLRR